MRTVKKHLNVSLALVVTSVVVIVVTFTPTPAASAPLPLFDERGAAVNDLFDEARRYPEFARSRWKMPSFSVSVCKLPYGRATVELLKRNAPFATLNAFSCAGTPCSGHFAVNAGPACGAGACGDDIYDKYFAREDLGGSFGAGWYVQQDG